MSQQQQQPTQQVQQQPQQGYQMGTQLGQQLQQGQFAQQIGQRFDESVPSEVRIAIDDLDRVATVAEWAKHRACHRGMGNVARVCDDIQDVATLEKKLIVRQSPFANAVGQAALQTIQDGLQDLRQYMNEPEVQDAIADAQRSLDSINKGLSSLQAMGTQAPVQPGGQQPQFGGSRGGQQPQFGGQQSGQQPQFGGQQSGQQPQFGGSQGGQQPQLGGQTQQPPVGGQQGGQPY